MRHLRHVVVVSALTLLAGCAPTPDPGWVSREWSNTARELMLRPIFPPREDFFPGDLHVTFRPMPGATEALSRQPAVWFDHVDLDLDGFYATRPAFRRNDAPTYATAGEGGTIWRQPGDRMDAAGATAEDRQRLRLVSFPAVTFASSSDFSLGLNAPASGFGALLGLARTDRVSFQLTVAAATSAGVPAMHALDRLGTHCRDRDYPERLRAVGHMLGIAADDGTERGRAMLVLATEVFYTRALDYSFSTTTGTSAQFQATLAGLAQLAAEAQEIASQLNQLRQGSRPVRGPGAAAPLPGNTDLVAMETRLAELRTRLDGQARALAPSVPGATTSLVSVSAGTIRVRQSFERPVAIGYRGLTLTLEGNSTANTNLACGLEAGTVITQAEQGRASRFGRGQQGAAPPAPPPPAPLTLR